MATPAIPPQQLPIEAQWCLPAPTAPPCIELEVARTAPQQSRGLMGRPPLPRALRGMWFPYDRPHGCSSFGCSQTPSPLDTLFLRGGRVIAIEANTTPCPRAAAAAPTAPMNRPMGWWNWRPGRPDGWGLRVGSAAVIRPLAAAPRNTETRD
jgi:uncharacterized membrane protein (UPF0127 family)